MNRINEFDPFSFIVGILGVIAGIISVSRPDVAFSTVVLIVAVFSIIRGIFKLTHMTDIFDSKGWIIFNSILDILIGVLMLFNGVFGMLYIAIFFAIMFILDSLTALSLAKYVKNVSHGYYIMDVIFAILGVIVGILLLISPVASALSVAFLVGIFFLVSGILMIVHSI
ncbi:DUF308 domain-containing protein [Apilactobacillus sp. EABW-1NA]|uniref:HdeD family acid-resistance protein n=1 Tax=Apilactobacillus sp. EABW-1NA TaxID=2984137 RepID=UPI0025B0326A|nr:DUF308 domain-containing protein [Apilactobacillus sp. EABW-1NA]MDN2612678.1 DUF308 domain-containing protein [Apilactobacillus sp. EABW-1NA]